MSTAVFLFHRDFRTYDQTGLNAIARSGLKILPVFIFPPEQIDPKQNKYFSNNSVAFMCESLVDLDGQLRKLGSRLHCIKGDNLKSLARLHSDVPFLELHCSDDYTPYATKRDTAIQEWCLSHGIAFHRHQDVDLLDMSDGLRLPGQPYQVFKAYLTNLMKNCTVRPVDTFRLQGSDFCKTQPKGTLKMSDLKKLYKDNPNLAVHGGRTLGLQRLKKLPQFKDYYTSREIPGLAAGTTLLSAYIKYGCVSVREVFGGIVATFGKNHALLREVVFRSFYAHVTAYNPHMLQGHPLKLQYERIPWREDPEGFKKWCQGTTGIPLVDAGLRCLGISCTNGSSINCTNGTYGTGHLHNRVRMVVASFLVKNLLIDWTLGEKFMYSQLVDADASSNGHGWQFISGSGCDSMQYTRVFNPFLQSKKYDPDAEYIKKWVPELKDVPAKDIHRWDEKHKLYKVNYPAPMVDVKKTAKRAINVYKNALHLK